MASKTFSIGKIFKVKALNIATNNDHVFSVCFSLKSLFILLVEDDKSQLCGLLIHHAWN